MAYNVTATLNSQAGDSQATAEWKAAATRYNACLADLIAAEAEYNELEAKIKSWENYLPSLEALVNKYNEIVTLIGTASSSFSNGGYIDNGKALLSDELSGMLKSLESTEDPSLVYSETQARIKQFKASLETKDKAFQTALNNFSSASIILQNTRKYPLDF